MILTPFRSSSRRFLILALRARDSISAGISIRGYITRDRYSTHDTYHYYSTSHIVVVLSIHTLMSNSITTHHTCYEMNSITWYAFHVMHSTRDTYPTNRYYSLVVIPTPHTSSSDTLLYITTHDMYRDHHKVSILILALREGILHSRPSRGSRDLWYHDIVPIMDTLLDPSNH